MHLWRGRIPCRAIFVWLLLEMAACGARSSGSPPVHDAALRPTCGTHEVTCDEPPPSCPARTYPAVAGSRELCAGVKLAKLPPMDLRQCWTGECLACEDECVADSDCVSAVRHGCCWLPPDDGLWDSRFHDFKWRWVVPRKQLASEACLYDPANPPEVPPPGCPAQCQVNRSGPEVSACGPPRFMHCGDAVRCIGGRCVGVPPCLCW